MTKWIIISTDIYINEYYNQIKWTNLCRSETGFQKKNGIHTKITKEKSKPGWEFRLETQIKNYENS